MIYNVTKWCSKHYKTCRKTSELCRRVQTNKQMVNGNKAIHVYLAFATLLFVIKLRKLWFENFYCLVVGVRAAILQG